MKLWKLTVLAFLTLLCLAFLISVAGPLPCEGDAWRKIVDDKLSPRTGRHADANL